VKTSLVLSDCPILSLMFCFLILKSWSLSSGCVSRNSTGWAFPPWCLVCQTLLCRSSCAFLQISLTHFLQGLPRLDICWHTKYIPLVRPEAVSRMLSLKSASQHESTFGRESLNSCFETINQKLNSFNNTKVCMTGPILNHSLWQCLGRFPLTWSVQATLTKYPRPGGL
jgi:hypothetical protein